MSVLKIGSVVFIPSSPELLMTVTRIHNKYLVSGLLFNEYDSEEKYDVDVVYFNGTRVFHDTIKLGALAIYSRGG